MQHQDEGADVADLGIGIVAQVCGASAVHAGVSCVSYERGEGGSRCGQSRCAA